MGTCGRVWVLVAVAAAGCRAPCPVAPRPAVPSAVPVSVDLPATDPTVPVLDGKGAARPAPREPGKLDGAAFRRLTEADGLALAAANVTAANLLDEENRVPPESGCEAAEPVRRSVRFHAALELRNRAAADALERFFQLADAECRADLLRQTFPVVDDLLAKARRAKAADVRFPLDIADLERQRSQLVTDLERAEHTARLLNVDLKRRLGLPPAPGERLWPVGDFAVDPKPADPEAAAAAALADRPELRGLRALAHGLTPDTLPAARDALRAGNPLLGRSPAPLPVRLLLLRKPDPSAAAELEVRRGQLFALLAERERSAADEARAAALAVTAAAGRVGLARERLAGWEEKLADAVRKKEANQPGAEFAEPQVRTEWLKARAEVAAEVSGWHQARVRLRAAQGWLGWEAAPGRR
ncbi:MAG: hypothetical protein C0501_22995 [Isosphaera sp.]|nr:hypothetical protein [Isosphaera sp.]